MVLVVFRRRADDELEVLHGPGVNVDLFISATERKKYLRVSRGRRSRRSHRSGCGGGALRCNRVRNHRRCRCGWCDRFGHCSSGGGRVGVLVGL